MKTLTEELKETAADLNDTIASFNDDQFNKVPFEGSWTAGQVAEHIFKSMEGTPELLNAENTPAGRDPGMHVKKLRDMFLDYNSKFQTAPFLRPSDGHHDAGKLSADLEAILKQLTDISANEDLDLLVTNFEFPTIGKLTKLEILNFISVHTQRHIHQMKNIKKRLEK